MSGFDYQHTLSVVTPAWNFRCNLSYTDVILGRRRGVDYPQVRELLKGKMIVKSGSQGTKKAASVEAAL